MGTVWLAHHERLDAEVAVKLIDGVLDARDPHARERFRREATLGAQLHSPHAVRIFDHGELEDGRPYLVMERLVGETLGTYLARSETLSPPLVLALATQLAAVLEEAHALGVVHRDVKPENLFLVDAGGEPFVKLLDFGVAKRAAGDARTDTTLTGALVGTPEYMSPEQLLARDPADPSADRWALAVVIYRCLTGRAPFSGETLPSLTLAICQGDHEPPSELAALPESVDAWCARAFAPERSARFESATAMVEALAEALRLEGPTTAAKLTPRPRVDEPPAATSTISGTTADAISPVSTFSRRSLAGALAALALAVGVAYIGMSAWQSALPVSPAASLQEHSNATPAEPSTAPRPRLAQPPAPPIPEGGADLDTRAAATSALASTSARVPAVGSPPTATPAWALPTPAPRTSATKPGCENPFELDTEGDLVPRPGCM